MAEERKTRKVVKRNRGGRKKGTVDGVPFTFTGLDGEKYSITQRQRKFAELFIRLEGNGVDAVFEAGYRCTTREVARTIASENLRKHHLAKYIEKIIEDTGLNDPVVDKHLLYNVTQFADLSAKNKAIDMYYKKKGKYAPKEHEHKVTTVEIVEYGRKDTPTV